MDITFKVKWEELPWWKSWNPEEIIQSFLYSGTPIRNVGGGWVKLVIVIYFRNIKWSCSPSKLLTSEPRKANFHEVHTQPSHQMPVIIHQRLRKARKTQSNLRTCSWILKHFNRNKTRSGTRTDDRAGSAGRINPQTRFPYLLSPDLRTLRRLRSTVFSRLLLHVM